jgi:hypothetical protein
MTKKEQAFISLGAMIGGLVLCGFAMTSTFGEPISSISIVLGLVFSVGGFIFLILALKRPNN